MHWRITTDIRVLTLVVVFIIAVDKISGSRALEWSMVGYLASIAMDVLIGWLRRREAA